MKALIEDMICWASASDLQLSIFGVESFGEAKRLEEMGVDRVTVSDFMISDVLLVNE